MQFTCVAATTAARPRSRYPFIPKITPGGVARTLAAATLLISPVQAAVLPFTKTEQDSLLPTRHLLSVPPGGIDTYLAPKNAFEQSTGFKVLDGGALGSQATLADPAKSETQVFTLLDGGQIQLNSDDGSQACLTIRGAQYSDHTPVELSSCDDDDDAQKWVFWESGSDNYYTAHAVVDTDYCLDVTAYGTTTGTNIELYPCNGGSNQEWTLVSAG